MARIWGSIRRATAIIGVALLCIFSYYALLYLVSPHPPHVDYPIPSDLPPGALVAEGGYIVTAYNTSPPGMQLNSSGLTVTHDTSNLSGKVYVADNGVAITSGYGVNLSEEQGTGPIDTSGSGGLVSFFELPLWIQLRFLPMALFGGLATFFGAMSVVRRGRKENRNKDEVLTFIKENPGCTAPELSRGRNLNIGTVRYYIKKLEDEGRVVLAKIGKFSRIFVNSHTYDDREKLIASHLRNDTSRQILAALMENPGISNQKLSEKLGMEKSLAFRYLKKLLEDGIVTFEWEGKNKLYYIDMGAKEALIKLMPLHYQCPGLKKE